MSVIFLNLMQRRRKSKPSLRPKRPPLNVFVPRGPRELAMLMRLGRTHALPVFINK